MSMSFRDIFYSVALHFGLLLMVTVFNPFTAAMRPDLESVAVNLISMPPLGNPDLIQGAERPEIAIPEAMVEEDVAIPISTPESRNVPKKIERPKEKPKPEPKPPEKHDNGYQGKPKTGDEDRRGGADVSDQLGPGTKFGSVSVDNASFNYPTYFIGAFGKIQRNWVNPVAANQPLACIIHFQILRSGTILDPEILKSSGVEAYDRACMRALQAADPLPPLPTDFRDDIIGINLEFPYQPR